MVSQTLRCPDISTCRASHSGAGNLVYCLNDDRIMCDYSLPYGGAFFCRHPQCVHIAARSEAEK